MKDLIEFLNLDELDIVVSYLDHESLSNLSITSKSIFNIFKSSNHIDYWIKKLSTDFNISANYLMDKRDSLLLFSIDFKEVYLNLRTLSKNQNMLPRELKYSYQDKNNYPYIFASCTNNLDYFCSIIPLEECGLWSIMSVYAGCEKPFMFNLDCMFTLEKDKPHENIYKKYLQVILKSGRKDIFIELQTQKALFQKLDLSSFLVDVACSGNIELFEYLLDPAFQLKIDSFFIIKNEPDNTNVTPLNHAALFGHLNLVKFILAKGVQPTNITLQYAVNSGNLELVEHLINEYKLIKNFDEIIPLLQLATRSGNKELIDYLNNMVKTQYPLNYTDVKLSVGYFITSKNKKIQKDYWKKYGSEHCHDHEELNYILGLSGNMSILRSINDLMKNPTKDPLIKLNNNCLDLAAENGHIDLVKCLIEEFKINPTEETLVAASKGRNLNLIKYLIDKKFDLFVDLNKITVNFETQAITSYLYSTFNIQMAIYCIQEQKVELDKIYSYLSSSFEAAPQLHLDTISSILLDPDSHSLHEYQLKILYSHLDNLSQSKSGVNSLPIYGKLYKNQINKMISCIKGDYSEEQNLKNNFQI
ncbi:MAG: ankyrin repeat domain-containing protein [Tatlockia sp.]|nr:ankyrin repeat domain-containing protein [Tatlockia sp.]